MKRYINKLYDFYKFEPEINSKEKVSEKFYESFLKKTTKEKESNVKYFPFKGRVFELPLNGNSVIFLVLDEDNPLTLCKVSTFIEFATQNDIVVKINEVPYLIEIWNKFYLTKNQVINAEFIGELNKEDFNIIKDYYENTIKSLPDNKRGFNVPEGNYRFIQNQFQKDEAEIVLDYALAHLYFEDTDEFIIRKENLSQLPLLASSKTETFVENDFFELFFSEENLELEFVVKNNNLINKPVNIVIDENNYLFDKLPESFKIKIDKELKAFSLKGILDITKIEILK